MEHFNNNAKLKLQQNGDNTTYFECEYLPLANFVNQLAPNEDVRLHFIVENNKIGLIIESGSNALKFQNNNLVVEPQYVALKTNYINTLKPQLDIPTTKKGQTEYVIFSASQLQSALSDLDSNQLIRFNLGQITTMDLASLLDPNIRSIVKILIIEAPNNLTLIMQGKSKTSNSILYYDASDTHPPFN